MFSRNRYSVARMTVDRRFFSALVMGRAYFRRRQSNHSLTWSMSVIEMLCQLPLSTAVAEKRHHRWFHFRHLWTLASAAAFLVPLASPACRTAERAQREP